MTQPLSAVLYKTEGSSDKEYRLKLEAEGDGWTVSYANGKRGRAGAFKLKTANPVPYADARAIYDGIHNEKTRKGYTTEESGAAYAGGELAGRITGFRPQLLTPMTREQGLAHDDDWYAQEKHDGERRPTIAADDGTVLFSNRNGLAVPVQEQIATAMKAIRQALPSGFILDGEDMGDHLVIFDVPKWPGQADDANFRERAKTLGGVQALIDVLELGNALRIDHPMPFSLFCLTRLPEIEARKGEGYVLKDPAAPYEAGRPGSGGPARKVKFTESATCRVSGGKAGKRSVSLELMDETALWLPVGNVTIPANYDIPSAGALVEVEYLYAYEGGSLFQPVYKGERRDQLEADCVMSQLKYKGEGMATASCDLEAAAPGL